MTITPTTLTRAAGRRRRRRRSDLHRRPDQPPARRRHLRHHDRVGGPQLPEGADGRPGPGRHHRHVPPPGEADRRAGPDRLRGVQRRLPRSSWAPPSSPRTSSRRWPTPTPATSTTSSPRRPAAPPAATSGCWEPSSRCRASPTWPAACVFGIALFRARVLARWAAALLAVGGVVSVALAVMPDAFYRFLAFPNGIAMIALGYSLWRVRAHRHRRTCRPLSTARASPRRVSNDHAHRSPTPGRRRQRRPGGRDRSSWRVPVALVVLSLIPVVSGSLGWSRSPAGRS